MNSRSLIPSTVALALAAAALSGCALLPFGSQQQAAPDAPAPGAPPAAPATSSVEPTPAPAPDTMALKGPDAVVFAANARIVNVDDRPDYRIEHVDGATNVPLSDLADASAGWDEEEPVLVTSRKTGRARSGARLLLNNGFKEVAFLDGGHEEWTGAFAGRSPRDPRERAKLYYIHSGWAMLPRAVDYEMQADIALAQFIADGYSEIQSRFDEEIDFEIVDASARPTFTRTLLRDTKAPLAAFEYGLDHLIPCWILVDKNGRTQFLYGVPDVDQTLSIAHGWLTNEAGRRPVTEPIQSIQTP